MIDRELTDCAQRTRRKPQIAALDGPTGWPGPLETCLVRRTDAYSAFSSRDLGNPGSLDERGA
jgi:hypothetical protein